MTANKESTDTNRKKKIPVPVIVIGIILLLAAAAGGIYAYLTVNSPAYKVGKKLELADSYMSQQDYDQAISAYEEAIVIDSETFAAYAGIAKAYIAKGDAVYDSDYEQAMKLYKEALKATERSYREPGDPELSELSRSIETMIVRKHQHDQGTWTRRAEPTCTEDGYEECTCNSCGEVIETRVIDKLGHTPGEMETEYKATCSTEGRAVMKCTVCSEILKVETSPKLEHVPGEWEMEKEASCEAPGRKVLKCANCGEILETEEIPQLAHEPGEWEIIKEADCVNPGERSRKCKNCGADLEKETIKAKGHQPGNWETVDGIKQRSCKVCGLVLDVREESSARLENAGTVNLSATVKAVDSPDGFYNVYAIPPADYAVAVSAAPIARVAAGTRVSASFALPGNGLYYKYVFGVNTGSEVKLLHEPQYITNPEVLATSTRGRSALPIVGKQGVQFANYYIDTGAGSQFNSPVFQINNTGSNRSINSPFASQPDSHPVDEGPFLYMLNTSDITACVDLANRLHSFAASSSAQDFIIGNEVNVRKWNYVAYMDWDSYVRQYVQAFRVAYNAIKSANANARVFICLDQNWDRNRAPSHKEYYDYLDGKDFLDKFNAQISAGGDIKWGVACHPHPVPLTWARFWNMDGCPNGAYCANQIAGGKMISFQNLGLLTNYLTRSDMLYNGSVRPVICSEVAIAAGQGADVQGASLFAAYMAAARNPYVESIIFAEDPSTGTEWTEQARSVFSSLGSPETDEWARGVIGITDWGEVLR